MKTSDGLVRKLRRALREIRDNYTPHRDINDNDLKQERDCFCPRCIAVRALDMKLTKPDSRRKL